MCEFVLLERKNINMDLTCHNSMATAHINYITCKNLAVFTNNFRNFFPNLSYVIQNEFRNI